VRYEVYGSGDPLLLIHGLAGSSAWWDRNVPALSQNFSVYLVDLPGFGASRRLKSEFSIASGPEWLASFLAALDLDRVSILGHSMGGLIAAMFAARWPEKVDRLILAAPSIGLSRTTLASHLSPVMRAAFYTRLRFIPRLLWDTARAGPVTLFRSAHELLGMEVHQNFHRELCTITAPCLLIWGERDVMVPVKLAEPLRKAIPQSCLRIVPRAGHVFMCERPEVFNDLVLQFLSAGKRSQPTR